MHAARFVKIGLIASLLGCWAPAPAVWAGQARLVEDAGPERVVIETTDASIDEVLAVLAERFAFVVERNAPSSETVRFSGRLQGSLDKLVERLLRHEGHMIVRSAEVLGGISRVVLLDAGSGPPPAPAVAGTIAAIKARLGLKEPNAARK
jgi:hypothetical protein